MSNCKDCLPNSTAPNNPCPTTAPCPPRLCAPTSYVCGDYRVDEIDGCTTRTRVSFNLQDGVYQNATVTLRDGCLVAVERGTGVVQSRPEPCGAPAPVGPPGTGGASVDPDPCNLSRLTPFGVLSQVFFDASSDVVVTGCGTPADPFRLTYAPPTGDAPLFKCGVYVQSGAATPVTRVVGGTDISATYDIGTCTTTLGTIGLDVNQCGFRVERGLVKQHPPIISNIVAGAGVVVQRDPNTCVVTISSTSGFLLPFVTCGPTPGSLTLYGTPSTTYQFDSVTSQPQIVLTTGVTGVVTGTPPNVPAGVYLVSVSGTGIGFVQAPTCP